MAALRIEGLSKTYGRTRAVADLSLTVEAGQLFGLLGPNGSGKTTTLGCALGLLRPDPATRLLQVLDRPSHRIHECAGEVASVFDTSDLVPGLTARQNLAYARGLLGHAGGRTPAEALELVGLSDLVDRRAGRMSLGQKRRLSIARALLGRPRLLVFDEPLSGLDPVGVDDVLALFTRLRDEGHTLVLSSHRLHEMERIVTHVAVIAGGRLLRGGTLDELLASVKGRVRLVARPKARARELLAAMAGVQLVPAGVGDARDDEIVVAAPRVAPAEINRVLVAGGCDVSALVPERSTLGAVFASLVAGAARAPGGADATGAAPSGEAGR